MRTKKEIEQKIKKLEKERKTIPQFSWVGNNNWKELDKAIETLKKYKNKDETEIEERVDKMLDVLGDNWAGNYKLRVLDWIIGNDTL
jgi:sugar-specific transcriptional regulator TrmB